MVQSNNDLGYNEKTKRRSHINVFQKKGLITFLIGFKSIDTYTMSICRRVHLIFLYEITLSTAVAPATENATEIVLLPENVDEHLLVRAEVD